MVTLKIKNLDKVLRSFKRLGAATQRRIEGELDSAAGEIEKQAIMHAPADQGRLRGAIRKDKRGRLKYVVTVNNVVAPWMEWGTKAKTQVPAEFRSYALQFKGQGSTGGNGFENILAWVKRKKLKLRNPPKRRKGVRSNKEKEQRQLAYMIWRSIRKYGVTPHPFLFPAFVKVRKTLKSKIIKAIKNA